jgi:two-component system, NtrC family, nitrogen regulation sensor histidine kinase NtrY
VTLALFAFFLVPTTLFGWVAYRAFAREVERAARSVAARAVVQAVQEFPESDGDLRRISERAGSEVLYFFDSGELAQASASEGLGLGVYSAWLSPDVHRALRSGEQTSAEEIRRLGDHSYLIAYHTLRPAGVLAVPTSLSTGDAAARQRELADLILFAAVAGGLLSFALSVAVGRSLAGPIGRLKRAAAAVGAGRLRVQLPEPRGDEFGELNASFNRMVRRLRRARIRERETARVLAWGEMARQVAHEIKNPLTPIKLSVQHLRRAHRDGRPEFGEILEESSEQILTEIDRLTEIARAFSRYGAPLEAGAALEPVEVHGAVREALTLYRAADESIRYVDELAPDLPAVIARPGELKEVLLNLVENAREALGGAGTVTVRGEAVDGRVELAVEDDGPGIPPDLLARVFDPHFSTRSTGTGLGLAIVRRLVESWGGTISAQSEPGRGTTMRLRIPANGQRAR